MLLLRSSNKIDILTQACNSTIIIDISIQILLCDRPPTRLKNIHVDNIILHTISNDFIHTPLTIYGNTYLTMNPYLDYT